MFIGFWGFSQLDEPHGITEFQPWKRRLKGIQPEYNSRGFGNGPRGAAGRGGAARPAPSLHIWLSYGARCAPRSAARSKEPAGIGGFSPGKGRTRGWPLAPAWTCPGAWVMNQPRLGRRGKALIPQDARYYQVLMRLDGAEVLCGPLSQINLTMRPGSAV